MREKSTFFLINDEAILTLFMSSIAIYAILSVVYKLLTKKLTSIKHSGRLTKLLIKQKEDWQWNNFFTQTNIVYYQLSIFSML